MHSHEGGSTWSILEGDCSISTPEESTGTLSAKMNMHTKLCFPSHAPATLQTVAHQDLLSMGLHKKEDQ